MKSKGVNFSSLFDPDIMGDGPTAPGYKVNGVAQRFADIKYGSKRANIGYAEKGVDLSNKWAAKGTAAYALGFDGGSYSATESSRGSADLKLEMKSNGTWAITRVSPSPATLASGTWLPSGEGVSSWACQFSYTDSGSEIGGGSNAVTNGAAAQSSLGTTRAFDSRSNANLFGQFADQAVSLSVKLYKNGALRSTSTCTFNTSADGR